MREMSNFFFLLLGRILPPIYRVSSRDLEEGAGQSYTVGATRKIKRGWTFFDGGYRGVIIEGNKSAGHCFVHKNLIPMNFFK